MLIDEKIAEKVIVKRAKKRMTKTRTALALNITRGTLAKIEQGNYDAPKRIYQSVMNWLVEDL
ncbi:TPA: transcriptional regulator [Streptococcus suis]